MPSEAITLHPDILSLDRRHRADDDSEVVVLSSTDDRGHPLIGLAPSDQAFAVEDHGARAQLASCARHPPSSWSSGADFTLRNSSAASSRNPCGIGPAAASFA